MSKKHKIRKIEDLKKDHGINLTKALNVVGSVIEMYFYPYHQLRYDYKYLEECENDEYQIEYYFIELLERLCWMDEESYCILRKKESNELIELLTKTIDAWDEWIDKRTKEYDMDE